MSAYFTNLFEPERFEEECTRVGKIGYSQTNMVGTFGKGCS
jgi:hypothetical protein